MSPTEPDITTERVVYIGRRLYNGTKIAHWYRSLEDHERTAGAHKAYLSCPIGSVLEVTHPADAPSAIYIGSPNGPRLVDSWTDVDELAGWRIRDRADYQQFVTAKRLQKDLEGIPRRVRRGPQNHRQPHEQAQPLAAGSNDDLHHRKNSGKIEDMKSLPELIRLADEVAQQRITSTTLADIEQASATKHLCSEDRAKILEILHTRMSTRTTAPPQ